MGPCPQPGTAEPLPKEFLTSARRTVDPALHSFGVRHLPSSNVPWSLGARRIRARLAREFLEEVHPTANVVRDSRKPAVNPLDVTP